MLYKKVDTTLNFVEREKEVEEFWKSCDIAQKAIDQRAGKETFTFYDGPPTANGKPHIGHVLTRVIKDMLPRYQSMKGKRVLRKAGWDTHGLPVELEVEKALGLDGKDQIEKYGMEPFIKKCRESVWKYKGMWEEFSDVVGFWADMEHPYITYENDFIESEWWALKEIWNRGLLYKGHKVVPYCPRCGTPLSSHEVAQGYKEVKERSAMVKFKAKGEDAYFLAWTTTPWTLPSNLGLCVNPDVTYVKIRVGDTVYYLAEALVDAVFDGVDGEREVLARMTGKELEYRDYEPLYPYAEGKIKKKAFFVICDDYVTTSDGTGIVHTAPAFGEDDNRVCRKYDMPFVQFVDAKGEMTADTDWPGVFVKDADPLILKDLKAKGLLFKAPVFEHSYPHCWRCDTPLVYYARESWFIKMTAVRDELIANNDTVNWIPESIGKGRFGDWLEHVQDWGISRNRYWGTPLNIWECSCGHQHSIGSIEELKSLSENCPEALELHRPYVDGVTIRCAECGGEMHRVPEVIDCWFDSGAMPFAQWHYPFENKEIFERGGLHLGGGRSDARLVLLAHRHLDAALPQGAVQERHRPRPCAGRERPQDVEVEGQCRRSDGGAQKARRGCDPLVLLREQCALAAEPLPRRRCAGRAAQVHGNAVEHLRFLCALRQYRQFQPLGSRARLRKAFRHGQVDLVASQHDGQGRGRKS